MPKQKQKIIPLYESFELTNEELSILEPHKLTEFIPMMTSNEIIRLHHSVIEKGFIDDIIITNDYKIIDGRARVSVAKIHKAHKPRFVFFNGSDNEIFDFIFNKNLNRRHLNIGQKTLIALKLFGSDANCEQLAKDYFGVNSSSIGRAVYVEQNNPSIVENIFKGKLTLDNAFTITKNSIKKNNLIIQNSYRGHSYMSTDSKTTSNVVKETLKNISQMFTDMLSTQQQQNAEFANKLNDMFGTLMEEYDRKNNPQKNIVNIYKDQFGMHNDYELANLLNVKVDMVENWRIENSIPENRIKQIESMLQIRMADSVENTKQQTKKTVSKINDMIADVEKTKITDVGIDHDDEYYYYTNSSIVIDEFMEMFNMKSVKDMADYFGITWQTINAWKRYNRIPIYYNDMMNSMIKEKENEEPMCEYSDFKNAIKLVCLSGIKVSDLIDELGITYHTYYNLYKKSGKVPQRYMDQLNILYCLDK